MVSEFDTLIHNCFLYWWTAIKTARVSLRDKMSGNSQGGIMSNDKNN
jgi:hypothetical protein